MPSLTDTLLVISDRQWLYSTYYVQTIVSAAGFNLGNYQADRDSSDLFISYRRSDSVIPAKEHLHIQVKSSYDNEVSPDGFIHYSLKRKNYDDLRATNTLNPHILVLVLLPKPIDDDTVNWIECKDNCTLLSYRAYWHSIMDAPAITTANKTVHIPGDRVFDVMSVRNLMDTLVMRGKRAL